MCIRDRDKPVDAQALTDDRARGHARVEGRVRVLEDNLCACLLYTSDAADDLLCLDLGGSRIIKKKNNINSFYSKAIHMENIIARIT